MKILAAIKNLLKKPVIITETGVSKIDTDLLFIPSFEELSENNQAKVLQFVKEVNIKDLDTIIKYTKNLDEEANFNSEFLLRLYYRLTDDTDLNKQNMQSDEYQTIIEINELNLCKNELLKLREEGVLRIIALNKLYKQETSRKLTFAGIFGRFEKVKRMNELKSLEDLTERLKISVKVIEQLIQVININVDANTLKVSYQDNLLKLLNKQDSQRTINDLVLETTTDLKIFLPEYETKLNFNQNDLEECLITLSVARRLLDLYAYKHKDEAINIIDDINELCNKVKFEKDNDKIIQDISVIERKYQVFSAYLHNNELVKDALKRLYKIKFPIALKNSLSFRTKKNKIELSCYEELVSNMLEDILKGNNVFFTNNPNLPKFSNEIKTELNQIISSIFKYSNYDLSKVGILSDLKRLNTILALSNEYEMSYQERLSLIAEIEIAYLPKPFTREHDKFIDYSNYTTCSINFNFLKDLFKIFIDYECYNQEKEMPYSFKVNLEMHDEGLSDKSILAKIYLNILQNSELGIILPGVKKITNGRDFAFYTMSSEGFKKIEIVKPSCLNNLPLKKLVISNDIQKLSHVFKECESLEQIDLRYLSDDRLCYNKITIIDCFEDTHIESLIIDYEFIERSFQIEYNNYVSEKIKNTFNENRFCLENFLRPLGLNRVMGDADTIKNRRINNYPWTTPLSFVRPFNLVIRKDDQVYTINVADILAEYAANDEFDGPITKRYPLAEDVLKKINKIEDYRSKQLKK